MPLVVDIDRHDRASLSNLPPFIAIREIGRSKVELLFAEDAEYIAGLFVGHDLGRPEWTDPDYWRNYDRKCCARLSPQKALKAISGARRRRGYFHKYDINKMTNCPRSHRCSHPQMVCRPVNRYLFPGKFACQCRPPSRKDGKYDL
ncbi:MAG: hypothetical protein AB1942_05365 [Pseudomonadota bacterium]